MNININRGLDKGVDFIISWIAGANASDIGITMHTLSLTHWGRVTHICVDNLTINGSDDGVSPGWRQAIVWTNAGIFLLDHWEQTSVKF